MRSLYQWHGERGEAQRGRRAVQDRRRAARSRPSRGSPNCIPTTPRRCSAGAATRPPAATAEWLAALSVISSTVLFYLPANPRYCLTCGPLERQMAALLAASTCAGRIFVNKVHPAMKALSKTTRSIKPAEVEKKWHLIDADGLVVGRLAVIVANLLRGKHKPSFTPHVDCGDHVVVINADKVRLHRQQARARRPITSTPATPAASRKSPPTRCSTAAFPSACSKRPSSG